MKEYFILSDIHSHYDLLINALSKSNFDTENKNHILLIAGDVLDRGKQGNDVIRFLEPLIIKGRVLGVLGNHDEFLLDVVSDTFDITKVQWNCDKNGFKETLKLGADPKNKVIIKRETILMIGNNLNQKYPVFLQWLRTLPIYLEFPHYVIVHGFIDFSIDDWRNTTKRYAVWERGYDYEVPEDFSKKIIFGHTPNHYINKQNNIIYNNKKIMIDGGASSNRQVNVLRISEENI